MTISEFVRDNGISISAQRVDVNPRLVFTPMNQHWKVVLKRRRATRSTFTVYFSRLERSDKPPTAEDVLDSLAVDAHQAENTRPRELAVELATQESFMPAYLETCRKRANGLKRVLGQAGFTSLLHETSRIIINPA